MKNLIALIVLVVAFSHVNAQKIFQWRWQLLNDRLQITGRLDNEETVVALDATTAINKFRILYRIVDELGYGNWTSYQKIADELSGEIIKPFEEQLVHSQRIIIEIDSSLLFLPVELLQIQHQSFAVFRPLLFKLNGLTAKKEASNILLRKGFILRDPTSDPEDACTSVFLQYPHSTFRSTLRVKPDSLPIKPEVDFILISAHGFADSITLHGCVFAEQQPVKPSFFQNTHPKLIYIDGCQQGINWSYIKTLAKADSAAFYLGPIVSNDSGESSTKTINWFFAYLKQSANPVTALWQTRKKLYQHYSNRIHKLDIINKSFIFRIYSL